MSKAEKAHLHMSLVNFIKANGKKIKKMDLGSLSGNVVANIAATGSMI